MTTDLRLFILNCAAIESDLRRVLESAGVRKRATAVETAADEMIGKYVKQFDFRIRSDAEYMSQHYELIYMLERDIRQFVVDTLEQEKGDDWWGECVPEVVKNNARSNRERELNEGISLRSDDEVDYLNFGELGEIIKSNWDIFGGFMSSRLAVEKVMKRLNMTRAVIAHSGMLSDDEVVRLKLNVRDWFRLFES